MNKPMSECNGREIMTEVLGYLQSESETQQVTKESICIPCMMPFITSQFLPRVKGDRPQVVPAGWRKLAFIGQFCELADDVVFTIESLSVPPRLRCTHYQDFSASRRLSTRDLMIHASCTRRLRPCGAPRFNPQPGGSSLSKMPALFDLTGRVTVPLR